MRLTKTTKKKIIFLTFLIFNLSCNKDFYEESIVKNKSTYNISKTTFNRIKDQKMRSLIVKSHEKILSKRNSISSNKGIEDFVIDTTNVIQISTNEVVSLTFPIISEDSTKLENLVSIKYNNQEYKSYVTEYYLDENEINLLNQSDLIVNNLAPDSIINLETENKISPAGLCTVHSYETVLACYDINGNIILTQGNNGDGCNGVPFDIIIEVWDINLNCNNNSSGGYSDAGNTGIPTSGGDGGGGAYSSNSPNDPNILTTPVNPIKIFNKPKTPCDVLKKVNNINKSAYINNHNNASNTNACDNCEYGYKFRMASNQNPLPPSQLPTSNGTEIGIPVGLDIYAANHSHPPNTYQMFSFHDINTLFTLYLNAHENIKQYAFFMLNNSNGTDYAILIDDFETFANFINEQLTNVNENDCEKALKKLENILEKKYKRSNDLEKIFLNFISNAGISLYSPTDANFNNWQKLSLPTNPNNPAVKTPCN